MKRSMPIAAAATLAIGLGVVAQGPAESRSQQPLPRLIVYKSPT